MLYEAQVVIEPVAAPVRTAYEFARRMENLPLWASGLSTGIAHRDGKWITQSPMGEVEVVMAALNEFGVLDHDVKLPDGSSVHNAFRVTPCGTGSLLTFTVLRMPGTTDAAFSADVAHVRKDSGAARIRGVTVAPWCCACFDHRRELDVHPSWCDHQMGRHMRGLRRYTSESHATRYAR